MRVLAEASNVLILKLTPDKMCKRGLVRFLGAMGKEVTDPVDAIARIACWAAYGS